MMRGFCLAIVLIALVLSGSAAWAADDPAEIERTWQAGLVFLPGEPEPVTLAALDATAEAARGARHPAIVYMHGCDGFSIVTELIGRFFATVGYVVVMPNSFARRDKPKSCDVASSTGGLHRAVLGWRHAEAANAIRRTSALPFVQPDSIVLMGLSEGGVTTATFTGEPIRARIVEGWTCHAGWAEYQGIAAPAVEPVLALLGADDPWFTLPGLKGDCGAFMTHENGSRSIVYKAPHLLAPYHYLTWHVEPLTAVVDFLNLVLATNR
ncbi:MAG: hypothetical protein EXQ99_06570 [Alphaproteobacteria bacterium]|nr:hypothetical protein [Alphaproteobacteria bacterium]